MQHSSLSLALRSSRSPGSMHVREVLHRHCLCLPTSAELGPLRLHQHGRPSSRGRLVMLPALPPHSSLREVFSRSREQVLYLSRGQLMVVRRLRWFPVHLLSVTLVESLDTPRALVLRSRKRSSAMTMCCADRHRSRGCFSRQRSMMFDSSRGSSAFTARALVCFSSRILCIADLRSSSTNGFFPVTI